MSKIAWIIFSVVAVGLLAGLVIWSRLSNPALDVSNINSNSILAASAESGNIADHTLGNTESKVILIEYGDFQCPSCAGAHPNVKTLMDEYGDRIAFVYRNFPLTSIHPNARAAAGAAEAAGLQGKYWEMHDTLFENQTAWQSLDTNARTQQFLNYAGSLNLDTEKFSADFAGAEAKAKIDFDIALGKSKGADATPAFFLNGEKVDSEAASALVQGDLTKLKELIDTALKS